MAQSAIGNRQSAIICLALAASLGLAASCMKRWPEPALLGGCQICHIDVADQLEGTEHARAAIGCITCHGRSKPHIEDENNEVKPDHIFKGPDIDDHCNTCHLDTCPQTQAHKRHKPPKTCAACHGAHAARLPGHK